MNKKALLIVGGTILGILVLVIAYVVAYGYIFGHGLDTSSKAWVDGVIPEITSTWNGDYFISNSSSEFLKGYTPEEISTQMAAYSANLGPLKSYRGSTGQAIINIGFPRPVITAEYDADVVFQKANDIVSIRAIREEGVWKILNFNIEPASTTSSN